MRHFRKFRIHPNTDLHDSRSIGSNADKLRVPAKRYVDTTAIASTENYYVTKTDPSITNGENAKNVALRVHVFRARGTYIMTSVRATRADSPSLFIVDCTLEANERLLM